MQRIRKIPAEIRSTPTIAWSYRRGSWLTAGRNDSHLSTLRALGGKNGSSRQIREERQYRPRLSHLRDGLHDIVLIPGTLSHLELTWERPSFRHLLNRLAEFARIVVFDKRGQGLSDRLVSAEYTLEERITDIRAVMDAAGSAQATVYGWSEGGPASLMFSASYPERTTALIL